MDVQLTVIRRGKQQLFTGVKVVPLGKVITLLTLRKNRGSGTGHDTADSRVQKGKRKLFLQSNYIHSKVVRIVEIYGILWNVFRALSCAKSCWVTTAGCWAPVSLSLCLCWLQTTHWWMQVQRLWISNTHANTLRRRWCLPLLGSILPESGQRDKVVAMLVLGTHIVQDEGWVYSVF